MTDLGGWLTSDRGRRAAILTLVAAVGVVVALLATGVLDRAGGKQAAQETVITVETTETTSAANPGQVLGSGTRFARGDWGSYGNTLDQNRHSPLTEVNKQNVNQLGRAFSVNFRRIDPTIPLGQQSFPIVVGGVIYVTTSANHVFAVDGQSGKALWHFKPSDSVIFRNYGINANRGVAYCDGKLFLLTLDMRIISIDPGNGKLIKEVRIADAVPDATTEFGYSETQAPICAKNVLLVGAAGTDYGVRGFFMAYRTDLTPAWSSPYWIIPPELEGWRRAGRYVGGGSNWNPSTVDERSNTVYITTSTASPIYESAVRPGPNPRTNSVIALDLATGRQKWWQQQLSGDQWGYSTSQPVLLYDIVKGGKKRRVVSVATKEGMWFMYDARTGTPIYERVRLLNRIEHATLKVGKPVRVYPSTLGGLNYSPSSYDPPTGYVINSQAETSIVLEKRAGVAALNESRARGDVDNGLANGGFGTTPEGWSDYGSITAVDAQKGTIVWKTVTPEPGRGGVTTTATGLTFAGGGDGVLRALDTSTGHVLWSFQTGFQIAAGPSVYEIDGKQYIAITTGGTFTSSYGGTASRLDVFTLGASQTQSRAPAIRPAGNDPGTALDSTKFLAAGSKPKTLALQLIGSYERPDGAKTLNGKTTDFGSPQPGSLIFRIPKGWHVNVTFANHSTKGGDGVIVVPQAAAKSPPSEPVFDGAVSPDGPTGTGPASVSYFSFTTGDEGRYAFVSTAPGHAEAGASVALEVIASNRLPQVVIDGIVFAVNVSGRRRG
jgi:alcohol dehydrogenase (cytochrome c)